MSGRGGSTAIPDSSARSKSSAGGAPPVLFVTGASGSLGGAVARLALAAGHEVHALARPTSSRAALGERVTWHAGDLREPATVERAVAAASAAAARRGVTLRLVHSAAVISYRTRDAALQRAANDEGTGHVLAAAARHGVERLVHVSSVVAVGFTPAPGVLLDESAPFNGGALGVDYVTTKRAAEERALAAAADPAGVDAVVVNPGAIFGPKPVGGNTSRFLEAVRRRRTGPFAPPGGLSVVGLDDTARGCLLALERGERGRRYLLVERYLEALELFRAVAAAFGVRPVRRVAPPALWRAAERALALADRVRPLEAMTPQAVRMLGLRFACDGTRARTEFGWRPRPFPEVLAEAVAGHRA